MLARSAAGRVSQPGQSRPAKTIAPTISGYLMTVFTKLCITEQSAADPNLNTHNAATAESPIPTIRSQLSSSLIFPQTIHLNRHKLPKNHRQVLTFFGTKIKNP